MILLVDNSNTRTKFVVSPREEFRVEAFTVIPTAELNAENVAAVAAVGHLSMAVIASVVPQTATLLQSVLQSYCPVCMLHADTPGLPVEFDYPGVSTLGADRVANIVAIAKHHPLPCIAVDAGTAITFDVVLPAEGKPRFVGGAISPGMSTMLCSMNRGTALLPQVSVEAAAPPIGRNTTEAMQAGVFWGACGMVDAILTQMELAIGEKPFVVATGGDAPQMAPIVTKMNCVDEWLTFRGLWQVSQLAP